MQLWFLSLHWLCVEEVHINSTIFSLSHLTNRIKMSMCWKMFLNPIVKNKAIKNIHIFNRFQSLDVPYLYCATILFTKDDSSLTKIEKIQNRFTMMIWKAKYDTSTSWMRGQLKVDSVKHRIAGMSSSSYAKLREMKLQMSFTGGPLKENKCTTEMYDQLMNTTFLI